MGTINKDYKPKEGNIEKLKTFLSKLDNKIEKKLLYRYGK